MNERRTFSLHGPHGMNYNAVKAIYESAFGPDEAENFEELLHSLSTPSPFHRSAIWGVAVGDETLGFGSYIYTLHNRFGFLVYLAVRSDQRGQGLGEWICNQLFQDIHKEAFQAHQQSPRLIFWEARSPDDPNNTPEVRENCARRIRFYERLGARTLPIAYTLPPIATGQPPVDYVLMVRTEPPGGSIDRNTAIEIAHSALVEKNQVGIDSPNFHKALESIDRHWPYVAAE